MDYLFSDFLPIDPWEDVETFTDLLHLNSEFHRGRLSLAPYTSTSNPHFHHLHAKGFFPIYSMPGVKGVENGVEVQTRAYVQCFLPDHRKELLEKLLADPNLTIFTSEMFKSPEFSRLECFNVCRVSTIRSGEKKWQPVINVYPSTLSQVIEPWVEYPNILEILSECVYLDITFREYGKPDLEAYLSTL